MQNKSSKRFYTLLLSVVMLVVATLSNIGCVFATEENGSVSVYFMARCANEDDITSPSVAYECRKLIVPAGVSVSDVTYAVANGNDTVVSGSGLRYYGELFGQDSGLTGIESGWVCYVNDYSTAHFYLKDIIVEDGMFILWEYSNDIDEDGNPIIDKPINFEGEKVSADGKSVIYMDKAESEPEVSTNGVEVYFMARCANEDDITSPSVAYECRKLIVPAGVSVSDVTYAVANGNDTVVSGSGLRYYGELFGQDSGLTGIESGWVCYVNDYSTAHFYVKDIIVEDGMFILWEYSNDIDEDGNPIVDKPINFEGEKVSADSKSAISMDKEESEPEVVTDGVEVYFMARCANEDDITSPSVAYECRKLVVPVGASVSDVTYAIENGNDTVVVGSGSRYYGELFGQDSGLTGIESGWVCYVNGYSTPYFYVQDIIVEDGMFILWEYSNDIDEDGNPIVEKPVSFDSEKVSADSKSVIYMNKTANEPEVDADTVEVYFMARGAVVDTATSANAITTPVVAFEPIKFIVNKGATVSDVTKAINENADYVTSGSGSASYSELFEQANGSVNQNSSWVYFVDGYNKIDSLSNEYKVYDNMFILWEYVTEYNEDGSCVINDEVDFDSARAQADSNIKTSLVTGILRGDTTSDGIVAADDAALVLQNVLESGSVDMTESVADFDRDGVLTANDAALILGRVLGSN